MAVDGISEPLIEDKKDNGLPLTSIIAFQVIVIWNRNSIAKGEDYVLNYGFICFIKLFMLLLSPYRKTSL